MTRLLVQCGLMVVVAVLALEALSWLAEALGGPQDDEDAGSIKPGESQTEIARRIRGLR